MEPQYIGNTLNKTTALSKEIKSYLQKNSIFLLMRLIIEESVDDPMISYVWFKKIFQEERIMKFCWSTLKVKNMDESIGFYEEIVGLKVERRFQAGPETEIAFLGDGETKIELICDKKKKEIEIGQDISWGFTIDSVDQMISFLRERGIEIQSGPFQPNPHSRFFYISDPNGMRIQFVETMG